jgi:hypothetical protein
VLSLQVAGWQRRESAKLADELALIVSLVEDAGGTPKVAGTVDADLAGKPEMD